MKNDKPKYQVPSMSEIKALTKNGFKCCSTFSGCGGSSLGYKMAGFDVLWASEFIPAAQETYVANHPTTILDKRDIRSVQPEEVLAAIGMKVGELDLFDGSPPCASFSTAGIREKGWGRVKKYSDSEQRTDDLFFEFVRLIKGIQPKVFVAENVKGLTIGTAKEVLGSMQKDMFAGETFKAADGEETLVRKEEDTILHALMDAGYKVGFKVLNAADLGVPQSRNRVIFIGIRRDLADKYNLEPRWPKPLGYQYTVRDALPWIVKHGIHPAGTFTPEMVDSAENPSPAVLTSVSSGSGLVISEVGNHAPKADEEAKKLSAKVLSQMDGKVLESVQQELANNPQLCKAKTGTGGFGEGGPTIDGSEVSPAIMAGGVGGVGPAQYDVESLKFAKDTDISRFAIGSELDKIKPGEQSEKYFSLVKPDLDEACPTITAAGGDVSKAGVVHPTEKRKFTLAELRRICGFPDDFILTGTYSQGWERLGRAVPPVMMSHIAACVRDNILIPIRNAQESEKLQKDLL